MPSSLVEVRREYTVAEETDIIDAIHESLVAAFRIPAEDRHVRLVAHLPHRFTHSPDLPEPSRYTRVTVDCFTGRSLDAKRNLYQEIVNRLAPLGIPRDHVTILVRESDPENWGIRGGQAACDVNLGFNVNV